MKARNNATLIKAARMLDKDADALRASSTVPREQELSWPDPDDKLLYHDMRRTADKLRAITLEKNP